MTLSVILSGHLYHFHVHVVYCRQYILLYYSLTLLGMSHCLVGRGCQLSHSTSNDFDIYDSSDSLLSNPSGESTTCQQQQQLVEQIQITRVISLKWQTNAGSIN